MFCFVKICCGEEGRHRVNVLRRAYLETILEPLQSDTQGLLIACGLVELEQTVQSYTMCPLK